MLIFRCFWLLLICVNVVVLVEIGFGFENIVIFIFNVRLSLLLRKFWYLIVIVGGW